MAKTDPNFTPICCGNRRCEIKDCNNPAQRKVEEVIFEDDPAGWIEVRIGYGPDNIKKVLARHPLAAYVCLDHFRAIMGCH